MGMKDDIKNKIKSIIDTDFVVTEVDYIPRLDDKKLTFGNTGLKFIGAVVFIDMRGSTEILNSHHKATVAKLHMSFFHTIVKVANSLNGNVRSFNGDSALIFFHGNTKGAIANAVKCAMKIKFMLTDDKGIRKQLEKYSSLNFGIGIDHGEILCTKIGIGGEHNRDIFWIGNSVNKSTVLGDGSKAPYHISISDKIYSNLLEEVKYGKDSNNYNVDMWQYGNFTYNGSKENFYYTSWHWEVI